MTSVKNIIAELNKLNAEMETNAIIIRLTQNDMNNAINYVKACVDRNTIVFRIKQISTTFPEEYLIWKLSLDSNPEN